MDEFKPDFVTISALFNTSLYEDLFLLRGFGSASQNIPPPGLAVVQRLLSGFCTDLNPQGKMGDVETNLFRHP